ncbi:MAG: NifU family protein [Deltaproteobacteria bacterium]|nr:NifU family protein [Deltaproteobacteria bacterium]
MDQWIEVAQTPNPLALMFKVESRLCERTHEYTTDDAVDDSPLAARLLAINGVRMVLVAPRFVTVERTQDVLWSELAEQVHQQISDFLDSDQAAVVEADAEEHVPENDVERKIVELIEEYVRPAIASDGGEIRYLGFEDGVVRLSLRGACGTCPSATTTLRMGVERLLLDYVPEVRAVENIPY